MSAIPPKEQSIKAMKNAGITKEQMKETMKSVRESSAIKLVAQETYDDYVPYMASKILGIVSKKSIISSGGNSGSSGGDRTSTKVTLEDIKQRNCGDVENVTVVGYIKRMEDALTRSDNPKKSVWVTNSKGTTTIKCAIFDECYEELMRLNLKPFDKIKFKGASLFDVNIPGMSFPMTMLTCGKFTEISKVKGNYLDKTPEFDKANTGITSKFTGVVTETDAFRYMACPECKKKYADESDTSCKHCSYEGEPVENTILHAGITNGRTSIDATFFGDSGASEAILSCQPITVMGKKKGASEMTVNNYRIEEGGIAMKPITDHFDDEESGSKKFKNKVIISEIQNQLQLYNDGISTNELIQLLKLKYKDTKKIELKTLIKKAVKTKAIKKKDGKLHPN